MTRYHVSVDDPHAHLYGVSATFDGPFPKGLELRLPTWTPGSYLQREFARHVQEVAASDESGRTLPHRKVDKAGWCVDAGGASRVTVRMRVYANDLTVRTSHLDATHGFFNGANLFLYRPETAGRPVSLSIDAPPGWAIATTLPRGQVPGTFEAADYDHLIDCPVEIGRHERIAFEACGVPHEVVLWGEGNHDPARLRDDLRTIAEAQAALMGGLPFRRYLFIVHLTDKGRGGLEHRDSTTLLYPRFGFRPRKEYEEFLRLAAHEYFHAWNVKRIKPKAFDPYDLSREVYTRVLWAMEGFTEYYEILTLARAGLISRERMLAIFAEEISSLLRTPGRRLQSLAESSFDAWIKHYRPDENSANSSISYYRKGALVAWVLDLELRARTRNRRSLDDLMRLLFERHGDPGKGLPEEAYAKALAELAGGPMDDLLAAYVDGTAEIDFAAHLRHAGLVFRTRAAEGPDDKGGHPGKAKEGEVATVWLGLETKSDRGRAVVSAVLAGSPAARAGLSAGDELVAIDRWRADEKGWRARANERKAGETLAVTVLRRDRLIEIPVVAATPPEDTAWIEVDPKATDEAREVLRSWGGTPRGESEN